MSEPEPRPRGEVTAFVAVSNPGGGIGRHVELTASVTGIDVLELPETLSLLDKVRALRPRLARTPEPLVVTHGMAAGLAARHRGRALRQVRHVEFWHNDPFFLNRSRQVPFRAIARAGTAPDVQVFVFSGLIPNYVDARCKDVRVLANSVPIPSAPRRDLAPAGDRAVYLGRLSPEKGYSDLVAAWPDDSPARGWSLDIYGDGPLAVHRPPPGISTLGKTPDPLGELASAGLAVIPSRNEASPYVALEAASVATPMVATRTGDLPMVLSSGCGWAADPADVASLRRALVEAQRSSPDERAEAGERGRAWLRQERPFETWESAVREIYSG